MKTWFLCFITLCPMFLCTVNAAAWEVKIVNNTGHELKYEVYQQTLWGEKLKCGVFMRAAPWRAALVRWTTPSARRA